MERYESLGLVGEGSYGTVLKCRHRDSGRLVAIKKFVDSDDDKTVKKIALREIRLLRQLRHDNLVNLLEVWKRRRRWYLVFEFVERTLLDDLEQNPSGLDLNTGRQYLYQILRAAAFCHQQNIIHRDIKPENILISQGGVVKMCDFGFARTMTSPAEGGVYTDYVATRWYRAPELLVGDTKYGKPVDVWAVGCLLLEMLTGQPLFPGDSELDQIYHIVRCFGNMTAHHQELFYRNPVFSGVRLPECSGKVPLEQRFPTITPTALDLAQSCLQMDPERRAQCSELLEHPLFTQDSFHIRFLDELNAKIQKDHRENSTLPKITKTPRRERNEEDDKNHRKKDKKQGEDVDEKVNMEKNRKEEEKMEKTKGKQPSKLSKTIRNTSEHLMSTKQSKPLGAKISNNAAKTTVAMKNKPGKATGVDLRKEPEISKSTKTLTSDSLEATKDLKDDNTVVAKPKHGKVASIETREDHSKNTDTDGDSSGMHSGCSDKIVPSVTSKSEPSQDFGNSRNNSNAKVPKLSKSSTTDYPNGTSSPKASLKSIIDHTDTHLTQNMGKTSSTEYPEGSSTLITAKIQNSDQVETKLTLSSNDVSTPTIPSVTKPTMNSEHHADHSTEQRRTFECPKVLPSNPKPSKTTSNSVPKRTKNNTSVSTSPSRTLTSDLSRQSSTVFMEASPDHTTTLPKGMTSEHHTDCSTTKTEQKRTSECPTVLPSKPYKTTSNSVPKITKNNTSLSSPSKTLTSDLSRQSSTVCIEARPAHNTTLPKGTKSDRSTTDTVQRRTSECPKVLPSNPKPSKTTSNSVPKMTKNDTSLYTSPSKTLTSDLSRQSSTVFMEASPAHGTTKPPKGMTSEYHADHSVMETEQRRTSECPNVLPSNPNLSKTTPNSVPKMSSSSKLSKTGLSSDPTPTHDTTCVANKPLRGIPTDRELTEVSITTKTHLDINEDHGCLKMSLAANHIDASGGDYMENPESSEPCSIHPQITSKSKITSESRTTSISMLNEIPKTNTSVTTTLKTLKASDKENREDLALSVSSATTKSLVNQISKVSKSSSIEQKNSNEAEPNLKSLKPPHFQSLIGEPKTKLGSFSNFTKSTTTMTLKTLKTTFPTEARKKIDNPEINDTTNISSIADSTSFTSTLTPAKSSIFHTMDPADVDEFAFSVPHSSPPPPPPPPSSTPLLPSPSSTPLIPSFSVVNPAASDHPSLGTGFHPGTHNLRCVDKPRHHSSICSRLSGHITGSLTAQVSEKSLICERSFLSDRCNLGNSSGITATKKRSDIHFPDLRSSVLPELRGREGKHHKSTWKDQRKDKQPSEAQQHGHNSTDTQTP